MRIDEAHLDLYKKQRLAAQRSQSVRHVTREHYIALDQARYINGDIDLEHLERNVQAVLNLYDEP